MAWGDGQAWERVQEVIGRGELKDRFQDAAQMYFDRQGNGRPADTRPALPPPPPKTDYLPFIIGGAATIVAALIVTRKK